jgi:hypothetical protein
MRSACNAVAQLYQMAAGGGPPAHSAACRQLLAEAGLVQQLVALLGVCVCVCVCVCANCCRRLGWCSSSSRCSVGATLPYQTFGTLGVGLGT